MRREQTQKSWGHRTTMVELEVYYPTHLPPTAEWDRADADTPGRLPGPTRGDSDHSAVRLRAKRRTCRDSG